MKFWFFSTPRLSMQSLITAPRKSALVIICALIYGSSMVAIFVTSGRPDGLCTSSTSPEVVVMRYDTFGTVVITSISNSRYRRSWIISICNRPRKPQRKPKPSARELSGSNVSDASLSCSFSSEARKSSYWSASTGYTPAKTIGFTSSKPAIASLQGVAIVVMVSPTFTSFEFLIPEQM